MQERVRQILEKLKNSEKIDEKFDVSASKSTKDFENFNTKLPQISESNLNSKEVNLNSKESNSNYKESTQKPMTKIPKLSGSEISLPSAVPPLLKSVLPEPK